MAESNKTLNQFAILKAIYMMMPTSNTRYIHIKYHFILG